MHDCLNVLVTVLKTITDAILPQHIGTELNDTLTGYRLTAIGGFGELQRQGRYQNILDSLGICCKTVKMSQDAESVCGQALSNKSHRNQHLNRQPCNRISI